jgi:hypothetical protein
VTYGPAAVMLIFTSIVVLGAQPDSPSVLIPFLVLEAIAIAAYVVHIAREVKRWRRH